MVKKKLSNPIIPASQDKFTYRIAVSVLSLVVLIVVGCVAVVIMIAAIEKIAELKPYQTVEDEELKELYNAIEEDELKKF